MDNIPVVTGLILSAFQRILLPLGYTDFQIETNQSSDLLVLSATGDRVNLVFIAISVSEAAGTRSPMALVAGRLSRSGITVSEVA